MLAITYDDYKNYGCPNCGCSSATAGHISCGGISFGTCRHCGLHFEIRATKLTPPRIMSGIHPENPRDPDSKPVMEAGILIPHPRVGIPKWEWEPADIRPSGEGEYWSSRGPGYDLSGFVKTRWAGERIHEMVKEVLGKDTPKSWLDYREREPEWIQYKFSPTEFDIQKLDSLTTDGVITKEILYEAKI